MISVILPTLNDEARLAACLEPLVPASMTGVVRELIIVDRGSSDATLEIADDAGALIIRTERPGYGGIADAITAAKGPWLLILDPAVKLEFGWEQAAKSWINAAREPARFRLMAAKVGPLSLIAPPRAAAHLLPKQSGDRVRPVRRGDKLDLGGIGRARLLDARGWV